MHHKGEKPEKKLKKNNWKTNHDQETINLENEKDLLNTTKKNNWKTRNNYPNISEGEVQRMSKDGSNQVGYRLCRNRKSEGAEHPHHGDTDLDPHKGYHHL